MNGDPMTKIDKTKIGRQITKEIVTATNRVIQSYEPDFKGISWKEIGDGSLRSDHVIL